MLILEIALVLHTNTTQTQTPRSAARVPCNTAAPARRPVLPVVSAARWRQASSDSNGNGNGYKSNSNGVGVKLAEPVSKAPVPPTTSNGSTDSGAAAAPSAAAPVPEGLLNAQFASVLSQALQRSGGEGALVGGGFSREEEERAK